MATELLLTDFGLILDLGLIVVMATIFAGIARWLKQPYLLAYIVAGVVIGPLGLGALGFEFFGIPLGITNHFNIKILSELGIAFLLFSVGVETDISKLFKMGKIVLLGGIMQVVITILSILAFNHFTGILPFETALYLGVILAFSSTMVVIKILSDSFQINTLHGRLMVGFLLVQDVLVIIAFPILANIGQLNNFDYLFPTLLRGIALLISAIILAKVVFPRIFKRIVKHSELLFLSSVSVCFMFIYIAFILDFSIAIGAFIAGLTLSALPYNFEIFSKIRGLRDFFVTIFFVSLGMQLTFSFAGLPITLILFIFLTVFFLKPFLFYIFTLFSGYGSQISLAVALSLAQVSEFSLVLASQGYNPADPTGSVLSAPLFSIIILTIALSMITTPYLMSSNTLIYKKFRKFSRFLPVKLGKSFFRKVDDLQLIPKTMNDHIVIIGAGTMGSNLAVALQKERKDVIVIDHDSEVIYSCIDRNINCIYGSGENEEILRKANINKAKLVILSLPDLKTSLFITNFTKKLNPNVKIFARAHYFGDALALYEHGADHVILVQVLGANALLRDVIEYLNEGTLGGVEKLKFEFMDYLKQKSLEEKQHFGI
ncbi:MAG: cation:proton antiporter [Candidatus Diapherotrites archaeon]